MKILVCKAPGEFEYTQTAPPVLQSGNAILKIRRIGICGTDLHAFEGTQPFFKYPRILGHELAGELMDFIDAPGFKKGDSVTFIPYFSCGKCIACRRNKPNCCTHINVCGVHTDGGMAEYLSVPVSSLVRGEGLSYDELALVEPLAIGAHGVRLANIEKNEFVLIMGAGPIGLGAMEFARLAGGNVIAMDVNNFRLDFCSTKLGIDYTINARSPDAIQQLQQITNGDMPTVVMDATGNQQAINRGLAYVAHSGKYVLVGLQKDNLIFSHPEFHKREATVMSSRNATRHDFEHVIASMKKGLVQPTTYITHRTMFDEVKDEFKNWLNIESNVLKVMVEV